MNEVALINKVVLFKEHCQIHPVVLLTSGCFEAVQGFALVVSVCPAGYQHQGVVLLQGRTRSISVVGLLDQSGDF